MSPSDRITVFKARGSASWSGIEVLEQEDYTERGSFAASARVIDLKLAGFKKSYCVIAQARSDEVSPVAPAALEG